MKFKPLYHFSFTKLVFYYLSFTWNGLDLVFILTPSFIFNVCHLAVHSGNFFPNDMIRPICQTNDKRVNVSFTIEKMQHYPLSCLKYCHIVLGFIMF